MTQLDTSDRRDWVLSVVDEYEGGLTRFAARMLGDQESARDVVQHAFLRLCERSPNELHDRVAPWLFTVCRNRAVDMLRARERTVSFDEGDGRECTSQEQDPAVAVEQQELYARLSALVVGLPPGQREAIDLWTEGFTYRQIAAISGRSEGSVRVLVHRALKRLRRHPIARRLAGAAAETDGQPSGGTRS
jgi:RNA polymerase sigma-70 factor (ECF subfamily)